MAGRMGRNVSRTKQNPIGNNVNIASDSFFPESSWRFNTSYEGGGGEKDIYFQEHLLYFHYNNFRGRLQIFSVKYSK
jgi:hypothetical protein